VKLVLAAAVLPLALAACTDSELEPAAAADSWAVATATVTGPPVSCIDRAEISGTRILDARTIDFAMSDGRTLRNRLPNLCPRLTRDNRFVYRTSLARICSTDLITLVQADGEAGQSCGLGLFQPIAAPPRLPPIRR
jgi:hypothetical protein